MNMRNKYIDSYIRFLNLKCDYKVEYMDNYTVQVLDDKENVMIISNVFQSVIVCVNGEHIGNFIQHNHDKTIWVADTTRFF